MWHVLLVLIVVFAISSSDDACAANSQNVGKNQSSVSNIVDSSTSKEITAVLVSLKQAVSEANAQSAAALWSESAVFIDESGEETHGRSSLQQRFEVLFQSRPLKSDATARFEIEFEPERVILLSENIASVIGVVSKRAGEESIGSTRFSMILEKLKGSWLIAQATETRIAARSAYEHLGDLDWLIGEWKTTTAKGSAALKVEWAPGKSFIYINCVTTDKDSSLQQTDRQIIGWDERAGSIVSWFFGHRGNFSYGRWRHNGSEWLVDVAGTGSDGTDIRSTDVYSHKAAGQFLWQSVSRSTAGISLPDTDNLTVERVTGGVR